MDREIKFRGYVSKKNRFNIPIGYIKSENIKTMVQNEFTNFPGDWTWNDCGLILEQYIGLKDKNGVEIYEGDILCDYRLDGTYRMYKIFRNKGGFVFNTHQDDFKLPVDKIVFTESCSDMQNASFLETCEVEGNIHEKK